MTLTAAPTISLEHVQRAAFYVLFDNLNDAIAEVEPYGQQSDALLAAKTGREPGPTSLEIIEPQNFVEGHQPSLINATIDRYPNVSIWAMRAMPGSDANTLDQASSYNCQLFIDVMVKASDSEETVNRRVHRTAEAVHVTLSRDPTLGGVVSGLAGEPILSLGGVFTRKETTAYGPEWFWQSARLEYSVRKELAMPSSVPGSIYADVDQL